MLVKSSKGEYSSWGNVPLDFSGVGLGQRSCVLWWGWRRGTSWDGNSDCPYFCKRMHVSECVCAKVKLTSAWAAFCDFHLSSPLLGPCLWRRQRDITPSELACTHSLSSQGSALGISKALSHTLLLSLRESQGLAPLYSFYRQGTGAWRCRINRDGWSVPMVTRTWSREVLASSIPFQIQRVRCLTLGEYRQNRSGDWNPSFLSSGTLLFI